MSSSPVLFLHISAGLISLLSGAAALFLRKGFAWHKIAGKVFVIAMLLMAASAACLGYMTQDPGDILGGITTIYVVITAWMTLRRKPGETGGFEIIALIAVALISATYVVFGLQAASSATGKLNGFGPGFFYFFAGLMAVFAVGDLRLILRGGISGAQRIARHLWRMCYALFTATGSFFLGQMKLFPEFIQETNVLFALAFAPLALMIFWLIRVRFIKSYRAPTSSSTDHRYKSVN